ncbi:hypothetical protein [Roseimaritima sediminicola]|uniref:hypothetical protein n=1 Tax=Roseimaritima sediminicola TaxID=2662066 RepID=UPI001298403D|nr:hypothetical protein [Roseimaritima sediminicola]
MNTRRTYRSALALVLIGSVAMSGCAAIKGEKSLKESLPFIGNKEKKPDPYPNPSKMAVTWTPDVIFRTGATPTRGFGGRVFFYDEKTRPVPVEGELAVQAIRTAEGQEPELKRYAFTPEQFTQHYSPTDLGASYSIWIPWDAADGEETKITLVPSFKPKEGSIIQGTSSVVALPGKRSPRQPAFEVPQYDALAGADGPYGGGAWSLGNMNGAPGNGLTTTTIPVHGGLPRGRATQPPHGALKAQELLAKLQAGRLQPEDLQPQTPADPAAASPAVQPAVAHQIGPVTGVAPASAQQSVTPTAIPTSAIDPASRKYPLPPHPSARRGQRRADQGMLRR